MQQHKVITHSLIFSAFYSLHSLDWFCFQSLSLFTIKRLATKSMLYSTIYSATSTTNPDGNSRVLLLLEAVFMSIPSTPGITGHKMVCIYVIISRTREVYR